MHDSHYLYAIHEILRFDKQNLMLEQFLEREKSIFRYLIMYQSQFPFKFIELILNVIKQIVERGKVKRFQS